MPKKKAKHRLQEVPLFIGSHIVTTQSPTKKETKPIHHLPNPKQPPKFLSKKNIAWIFVIILIAIISVWLLYHPVYCKQGLQYMKQSYFTVEGWALIHAKELFAIPVIILTVLGLLFAKIMYQTTIPLNLKKELTEADNPAIGLYFAGFLFGTTLALIGGLTGSEKEPLSALINILLALAFAIPLLRLSAWIQDKCLLYQFSILKELKEDRNVGTGAVCCGGFIGTGLIIQSSFIGESTTWGSFIFSILGAYFVGQAIFIFGGWVFTKSVGYNVHVEIGNRDNLSAGIIFGSFLASLGLVVSAHTTNVNIAVEDVQNNLATIAKGLLYSTGLGIIGIILLIVVGILTTRAILPKVNIDDEVRQKNPAVALIFATTYITVGMIIRNLLA